MSKRHADRLISPAGLHRGDGRLRRRWLMLSLPVMGCMLLGFAASGYAEPITILDDSFESPSFVDKTYESNDADMPDGWAEEHSYTSPENENNTNVADRVVDTPYGEQYVAIWDLSGIFTTNITDTLQPGVTYTLTFNVGNRNGDGNADPTGSDYLGEILAGTNVVASTTGTTDTLDFSQQAVVTLTTDGAHPHLGKTLSIRIAHNGPDWNYKTLVDNVRFEADESASEYKHTLHIGK